MYLLNNHLFLVIDDMELSQDQYTTYMSDGELMSFGRDGISYLWSNAEIPVTFDDATIPVSSSGRQLVEGTMSEMNKELCGCFRFRYIHITVLKFASFLTHT